MGCDRIREWSGATLLGEAPDDPPRDVAKHLARCDLCRAEVEAARAAWHELDALDEPEAPGARPGHGDGDANDDFERKLTAALARAVPRRNGGRDMGAWGSWKALAASVVLALGLGGAGGWGLARTAEAPAEPGAATAGPRYLLLLRETRATLDAEERLGTERIVSEYGAWAGSLAASGSLVTAEKLAVLGGTSVSSDEEVGVEAEAPGVVSGFFLVRAADADAALAMARESPHVRYGGIVEVRPIQPTGGGR